MFTQDEYDGLVNMLKVCKIDKDTHYTTLLLNRDKEIYRPIMMLVDDNNVMHEVSIHVSKDKGQVALFDTLGGTDVDLIARAYDWRGWMTVIMPKLIEILNKTKEVEYI